MTLDSRLEPGGHRLRRCSSCGRDAFTLEDGATCRQTAAIAKTRKLDDGTEGKRWICPGRLYAHDALAKRDEGVCERKGCGNGQRATTAIGERLCLRCLGELADDRVEPGP